MSAMFSSAATRGPTRPAKWSVLPSPTRKRSNPPSFRNVATRRRALGRTESPRRGRGRRGAKDEGQLPGATGRGIQPGRKRGPHCLSECTPPGKDAPIYCNSLDWSITSVRLISGKLSRSCLEISGQVRSFRFDGRTYCIGTRKPKRKSKRSGRSSSSLDSRTHSGRSFAVCHAPTRLLDHSGALLGRNPDCEHLSRNERRDLFKHGHDPASDQP